MDQKWKIDYYETPQGKFPVFDFIESLNVVAKSKISNTLDMLSEFGILLRLPRVKKVKGTSLWELRILGSDNIRIFYITKSGKSFLLLHGFVKKKQKTDKKEIKIALHRLKNYMAEVH
jgi:phage-related protein